MKTTEANQTRRDTPHRAFAATSLLLALLVPGTSTAESTERVDIGRFSAGALAAWQEQSFKGKTDYRAIAAYSKHAATARHRPSRAVCPSI